MPPEANQMICNTENTNGDSHADEALGVWSFWGNPLPLLERFLDVVQNVTVDKVEQLFL